jgi:predicted amidohydrolase YtcJ
MRLFLAVLLAVLTACGSREQADLLLYNATIFTVDSTFSMAEAIAIHEGKVLATGDRAALERAYQFTESRDMQGAFVYPGFIDAHCHFVYYGLNLQQVDLKGTRSWEEVLERLQAFAAENPDGWLIGRGWDQNDWPIATYPDRVQLDSMFPNRPVYLSRVDGHAAVANAVALAAAEMGPGTQIAGGQLIKRPDGSLSGLLIDNAANRLEAVLPAPDAAAWRDAILDAQSACHAVGLTSVHDAGLNRLQLEVLEQMEAVGELSMGVYGMISAFPEELAYYLAKSPYRGPKLHVRSFKFYADGALGSRGARLKESYHDEHNHFGLWVTEPDTLARYAPLLAAAGYQMNTHCIGDAANQRVPEIYAATVGQQADHRWRIEHAQVVTPTDLSIYKQAGIVPSVQPTHATSDMYWAGERLGPQRITHAYAYQNLLQLQGWLPLGTDFPVEDISPLKTFYAAVFRVDSVGYPEGGFQSENALSREQALRGMTIWAARAGFEENEKGSLEAGKQADLVVLDRNLMEVSVSELLKTKVLATYVGGKVVK